MIPNFRWLYHSDWWDGPLSGLGILDERHVWVNCIDEGHPEKKPDGYPCTCEAGDLTHPDCSCDDFEWTPRIFGVYAMTDEQIAHTLEQRQDWMTMGPMQAYYDKYKPFHEDPDYVYFEKDKLLGTFHQGEHPIEDRRRYHVVDGKWVFDVF